MWWENHRHRRTENHVLLGGQEGEMESQFSLLKFRVQSTVKDREKEEKKVGLSMPVERLESL